MYHSETKLQGWRAIAIFEDRQERLIFLGRSSSQVRSGYTAAFLEVLDSEEQAQVSRIALQRWHGAADAGVWESQAALIIPQSSKTPSIA